MSDNQEASKNYKDTVFLPTTAFPMRGGLPQKEPEIIARWKQLDLYKRLRQARKGREKFILHDGPPYANGNLHIGHALNKILKDVINRSQSMMGKDANYVPGWDCHGLPIEWKIEEQYRKKGKDKDEVPIEEFREECRIFAAHWMDVQSEEFQRLGVLGDWQNPYYTMKFESEAIIAAEIGKFLMQGSLYRGSKPVMWSPVEKTALAEAELEYIDRTSTTIFAKFKLVECPLKALIGNFIVIWTTTPWTIPGNRALAYNNEINYVAIIINQVLEDSIAQENQIIIVSEILLEDICSQCGITKYDVKAKLKGYELKGSIAKHPMADAGYDYPVPLLDADYVTIEQGTGFVHIAPGHGPEDYQLAHLKHKIEVPDTVNEDGTLMEHLPIFSGFHVLRDNLKIAEIISEHKGLIGIGNLTHSYPHSWRSHAPVIYRNTAQWFIAMESHGLRKYALSALQETLFYPSSGQRRLTSMIENRPDWCLSRQRAWGVPIPVFVEKKSGKPLQDQSVIERIIAIFKEEGCDAWFTSPPSRFLGENYDPDSYEKVNDIADVWFDSGSTHAFVLEQREDLHSPADLYLEGSDQHRGWFHSSLLESSGTRAKAPYKGVLTHGFVLDEQGRKMSKSLGNVIQPQKIIQQSGADILRLWVVSSDYYDDLRIGTEILKRQSDHYRRIRNTLRYLLGALDGFDALEPVSFDEMPELEKWVAARLFELDKKITEKVNIYDFHSIFTELHDFCNGDLSAFYFDIRKDMLYCDKLNDVSRRAALTIMDICFKCLVAWIAPILCFTADEAWLAYTKNTDDSIHLREYQNIPSEWQNSDLIRKWINIRSIRSKVTTAIENARAESKIGGSLQASVNLSLKEEEKKLLSGIDLQALFITSEVKIVSDRALQTKVEIALAAGEKCARCWKVLPEVKFNHGLCNRCEEVVLEKV